MNDVIVYNDDKTEVYTNGQDSIETPDASCLVRLKHILLHAVNDNNLAMDINKNGVIDICDLILLKKQISDMYLLSYTYMIIFISLNLAKNMISKIKSAASFIF